MTVNNGIIRFVKTDNYVNAMKKYLDNDLISFHVTSHFQNGLSKKFSICFMRI